MFIINAPFVFTAVYAIVKGFVDEKTRTKIQVVGYNWTQSTLKENIDDEWLPEALGGKNTHSLLEDYGPWQDYEVVDGVNKNDVVGVRKKGEEQIITPAMIERMPNPLKLTEDAQGKWD